jgi:hypothetical protein
MLLIFGLNVRLRPMEAGTFHCPDEGGDRGYTFLEARRWFTVFFVPVIPLKSLGMVVECDACGAQFDQRTLHLPTTATLEHKIEVAARSLLGAVAASNPSHAALAVDELEGFLGCPAYGRTDLIAHSRIQTEAQRNEALAAAGEVLDPAGRERLLMAAARAGTTEGRPSETVRQLIHEAGSSLGLTPTHIEGVLLVAGRSTAADDSR